MGSLKLPSGEKVVFGPVMYSRDAIEYSTLQRQQMSGKDLDEASQLRLVELGWHMAVQSLMGVGRTRDEAEAIMAQIPMNREYLMRVRDAIGLGGNSDGDADSKDDGESGGVASHGPEDKGAAVKAVEPPAVGAG